MVELRVIEGGAGGLRELPPELLRAAAGHHEMLANICEQTAAGLETCPPELLKPVLVKVRKLLRRMRRRYSEDLENLVEAIPECAAYVEAMRLHLRLHVDDLVKAATTPPQWRAWGDAHRRMAKRLAG